MGLWGWSGELQLTGAPGAAGHASVSVLCQQHWAKWLVHGASMSPAFGGGSDVRKCMNPWWVTGTEVGAP